MADTTNPGQAIQSQVTAAQPAGATTTVEPTLSELNERYLAMQKELEIRKAEIAGLNRKNSEYEKAIQAKELEKLSEKERAEKELEFLKQEKEKEQAETERLRRDRIVDKILFDNNIPLEFNERIKGNTQEEILSDVKAFNDFVEKIVVQRVEKTVKEKLGGAAPIGGTVTTPTGIQEHGSGYCKNDCGGSSVSIPNR